MKFVNAIDEEYIPTSFLTYNDISLVPQYCPMTSRLDSRIDLNTTLTPSLKLGIPIISANMDCVTGPEMAIKMAELGGRGILHRFFRNNEERYSATNQIAEYTDPIVTLGISSDELVFAEQLMRLGVNDICIDIAHAHSVKIQSFLHSLRNICGEDINFIVGNVSTVDGAKWLYEVCGIHCIKVGQGCGHACSTRVVTGHGIPQATAIMRIRQALPNIKIIADGGIRNSGDIVKSLALGANAVMIGHLLAGVSESAARYVSATGTKSYRGQSSHSIQESMGTRREGIAAEGVAYSIPFIGPLEPVFNELVGGLRSGMTYSGAYSIELLHQKAKFIEVGHHGYIEGTPHGKSN